MAYLITDDFKVLDGGILLDKCANLEEAQQVVRKWEARDNLESDIEEFIDEMKDKYGTVLPWAEIKSMIKER